MQYITLLDYIILPFVLLVVYAIAYRIRNKQYKQNHPYRKYFIPGLTVKIFGAILIGMIYQYYYGGGDTFFFFYHAKIINSAFDDSPLKWLNLLLKIPEENTMGYYQYIRQMVWYSDNSSYMVSSFTAFLSFFLGGTYLPTAVLFAAISFTGIWALFRAFCSIYPKYIKHLAVAILFIPSVVLWGSGIFKDTLCLASLGWLTYSVFQIMVKRNLSFKNISLLIISFLITYIIKLYILMAFIPALLVWVLFIYTRNIKNSTIKVAVNVVFLAGVIASCYLVISVLGEEYLGRYSLEQIEDTAEVTRDWISYSSGDKGSAYDLGEIQSPVQMLTKFPAAVNVTLFRPYLWESSKIIVLISAVEASLFLFLTLKVLFTVGLNRTWKTISADPTIQFCLIFTLIFAFAVGITTYNFGTLSRYKIPCLPFYAVSLLLIYYKNVSVKKPLFRLLNI